MEGELSSLGNELNRIWLDGFKEARQQFQIRGLAQDGDEILERAYDMIKAKLKG